MIIEHSSVETEYMVVGILLKQENINESNAESLELLSEDLFTTTLTKCCCRAIIKKIKQRLPFDFISVSQMINDNGWYHEDSFADVAAIVDKAYSTLNLDNYINVLKLKLSLRGIHGTLVESLAYLKEKVDDEHKIEVAMSKISNIDLGSDSKSIKCAKDIIEIMIDDMQSAFENGTGLTGKSSLPHIDKHTSGLCGGDLIVVAGKPSSGKTTLALNIAESFIMRGEHVLGFSLEMSSSQLMQKISSSVASVPIGDIRTGEVFVNDMDYNKFNNALMDIKDKRFYIDDDGGLEINQIVSRARSHKLKYGDIDLIFVDYIQIVRSKAEARYLQVAEVSMQLKALAKEMDCPVIALSQLAKNAVGRPNGSHLRESGQIEQDADVIMFLHTDNEDNKPMPGQLTELIFNKVRLGHVGIEAMKNELVYQRFVCTDENLPEKQKKTRKDIDF